MAMVYEKETLEMFARQEKAKADIAEQTAKKHLEIEEKIRNS
ncbi:hypothetical protein R83H12_01608 [Fibrobacteria bacterium R8-3-H12]